jgi:uncharacterized membrane protein SpoIIM required for sporulation
VDIDHYLAVNQPGWDRLAHLTSRARRSRRALSPAEIDELVAGYQRASAQLSRARTAYRDPDLDARLTRLVADAAAAIYGQRAHPARAVGRFFADTFPAAVWHLRRFVLAATLVMFVPAVLVAVWLLQDPAAMDASGSPAHRQIYVEDRFEQYYSEQPSTVFFTQVTTNNIRVSFTAFAAGLFAAAPGAFVLGFNGVAVGQVAAWMIDAGDGGRFFGLILPHGLLELSAIVIAGAAGLALGWAWIAPGDRRRTDALAEEGRRAAAVVLGLIVTFIAAGLIEGFVTGSGLPAALRVGVGAAAWVCFVAYLFTRGRAAAAAGLTGSMGEEARPAAPAAGALGPARPDAGPIALGR